MSWRAACRQSKCHDFHHGLVTGRNPAVDRQRNAAEERCFPEHTRLKLLDQRHEAEQCQQDTDRHAADAKDPDRRIAWSEHIIARMRRRVNTLLMLMRNHIAYIGTASATRAAGGAAAEEKQHLGDQTRSKRFSCMLPSSARPRRPVCTHRMISAAQNTMASATNASSSQLKRSDCAFSSANIPPMDCSRSMPGSPVPPLT